MGFELSGAPRVKDVESTGRKVRLFNERREPYLNEDGTPVTATVAGVYSKQFLDKQREISERVSREGGVQTADERLANAQENYAACVLAWDFTLNGESADAALIFATQPHIYEQIINAANDHAGFFPKPLAA